MIYYIKRIKTKLLFKENPLIINLKGKLQKSFNFFSDARCAIFGLLTCWLKYHVVLSFGVIIDPTVHVPPEKHSTENSVIAGNL